MTVTTLNVVKASEIAHSNETALATMEELNNRQRNRKFLNIELIHKNLLRKGLKIVDADYMKYWKDMQEAGVGSIVYGRKGNPDRFACNYNLKDVAQVALGGGKVEEIAPVVSNGTPDPIVVEAKRGRGRPKGSKNKRKKSAGKKTASSKRGRRPGSKILTGAEAKLIANLLKRLVA